VGAARTLGRLLQGLVALAVLVALVAALPWALWHYIGWPLPHHIPTADEAVAVLLSPMTTGLLLDVLACLCWITWAAFVIDVARCVLDAARGLRWPELHTGGPVHTVAAILVGVIVVSLLGNRGSTGAGAGGGTTEITGGHGAVVVTAPAHLPGTPRERPVVMVNTTTLTATVAICADAPEASAPSAPRTEVVCVPENGIHDTLSRIAARTLHDATRWPEIFQANWGKPQPNGGPFTNPNLIFPGERLALPSDTPAIPAAPQSSVNDHHRAPPEVLALPAPPTFTPAPTPSPSPASASPNAAPAGAPPEAGPSEGSGPGIGWEPGVFVGLGLAAAVSAALVAARRRYRRCYRPGSGRRDDLPVTPVVYQLRLAHLRADHAANDPDGSGGQDPGTDPPPVVVTTAPDHARVEVGAAPGLGVRDGREVALDLAVARGLGLLGPGAAAATRALLLTLLAPPPHPGSPRSLAPVGAARVIVPVEDLALVLGPDHTHTPLPDAVRVVADVDAALDELEAEMLHRAREHHPARGSAWPVIALVARPPTQSTQRLQAVLDNGAHLGLVGVILGQWRPGASAYIRGDGTVSATSPGTGEALRGTRMFHMPHAETADLLTLLRQAQPDTSGPTPIPPDQPTPSTAQPCRIDGPLLPCAQALAGNIPTALDAHDGDVVDHTALEVIAIPSAEGVGIDPTPGPAPPHADPGGHSDALAAPITLTVLGTPRVHWRPRPPGDTGEGGTAQSRDITGAFPPRQRELLVFLALHPDGVHRDALVGALWEDNLPARPTNALNTALSRLRRSLSEATGAAVGDITTFGEGRYQLDPDLVDVDYWRLGDAVAARRAACSTGERITTYQRVVDCYGGSLAEGMDTEWIDAAREATRRDAIDAVAALARALVDSDPQRTLDLLETARAFDPHNELLYRDIMRLQQRLGHLDAIPRTLTLLGTRLAEIGEAPTADARSLAARLQRRHDGTDADAGRIPGRGDLRGDRRGTAAAI
jgi:DNA-binding SARP family transcriptional activator